jgi:hypothetical protein
MEGTALTHSPVTAVWVQAHRPQAIDPTARGPEPNPIIRLFSATQQQQKEGEGEENRHTAPPSGTPTERRSDPQICHRPYAVLVEAEMRRSTALTAVAALLLLAASLAAAYMSIAAYVGRSEEVEARRSFADWMAKFNKTYGSTSEEEHRYAVYKKNLRRQPAGLNGFGDLTEQELMSIYPGCGPVPFKDPRYSVGWSKKGTGGRGQAVSR